MEKSKITFTVGESQYPSVNAYASDIAKKIDSEINHFLNTLKAVGHHRVDGTSELIDAWVKIGDAFEGLLDELPLERDYSYGGADCQCDMCNGNTSGMDFDEEKELASYLETEKE